MFGGMNFFPEVPRPFNTQYRWVQGRWRGAVMCEWSAGGRGGAVVCRCYPVAMMPGGERSDVEAGGKIIMPPSALDQLTRLNIVYPMLFKVHLLLVPWFLDSIESCDVLQTHPPPPAVQQEDEQNDPLRGAGVRGGRGQDLHSLLDDAGVLGAWCHAGMLGPW